jgi:predicted alpha-1,2-mannosidase
MLKFLTILLLMVGPAAKADNLTQYVDPFIGTGGHGHVFLGANVPFGLVQLGPNLPDRGWDWCSGYHYSDSVIVGFSHMHLSGTGVGDLGDIAVMPVRDVSQRRQLFSHRNEQASPGYYSLYLDECGVLAELTATLHCGMHRYTYSAACEEQKLLFDLEEGIGWDGMRECAITQENETTVTGFRRSKGWANDQWVFFAAQFSKPVTLSRLNRDTLSVVSARNDGTPLLMKVGISAVSSKNALQNLEEEIPGWDFNDVAGKARQAWESQLGKVRVQADDEKVMRIFYTALYHTMVAPSVFSDVNGEYRGADGQVHSGDFVDYTTLSLWDTYRAAHPLMTLIHPERQADIAQTMLHIFREQGRLPVWHLMGNETDCMVGNPAIPVLADLTLKGYEVDAREALEAMRVSALREERGLALLRQYQYLPWDLHPEHETVAKGLEYALADYCVAKVAKMVGNKEVFRYFDNRCRSYRKYFDPKTRFMRALSSQGKWREPFNPFHAAHRQDDYTEGNAWQYLWLVPHDVDGLVKLLGGDKPFAAKLDSLFVVEGDMGEEASPDITGLIGQYAHGNEPSHHVIYLYHYVGMPWRAAPLLRQVMSEMYHDDVDGLCGNEDVGQMSAWYILSAMGLYQVEPAGGRYLIGSPVLNSAEMSVGGKTFTVIAHHNSDKNMYVQSAKLNGRTYTKSYIDFKDIVKGGTLELTMGPQPSSFGKAKGDRP